MKSVVVCSSTKFKKEVFAFATKLQKLGVKVYCPPLDTWENDNWNGLTDNVKRILAVGLNFRHLHKIAKADAVFIFNKGGYAGVSVSMEIGYAVALNKPIFALEKDSEIARDVLYEAYTKTPRELAKALAD